MSNINLRKDCEALYTFDQRSFDSQRNVIQDRSGHGRHAEANGGPSIGVNGPDGYNATSLDGSDDYIYMPIPDEDVDSYTYHIRFLVPDYDIEDAAGLITDNESPTGFGHRWRALGQNDLQLRDKANNIMFGMRIASNKWHTLTVTVNTSEDEYVVYFDGELKGIFSGQTANKRITIIGRDRTTGDTFTPATVSLFMEWGRSLTRAEIDYLNRLTGPRRAQL